MLAYFILLLSGAVVTIELAICALALGLVIGIIGAFFEMHKVWVVTAILIVIRSLPELLVLFFIYFGITSLATEWLGYYINFSPFFAGTIALGSIFGAYASQVFSSAFLAIDKGQIEAGAALGLTRLQIFFYIELPQSVRHAIPGLGNLWLVLLKDTAIVMLIGLSDLMNQANLAAATTYQPFTYFLLAAFIYLVITSVSQQIIYFLNIRANRYIRQHE